MLKKTLVSAALAALSGTALAHPQEWAPAFGYRAHHYHPYVRYYPVAPHPVYVVPRPVVVAPAPVYIAPRPDAGAILFGALLGAVVAHEIVTH